MTVNTNYGRVNGFFVYLYDGPRVPEFDRPGVANVDKVKFRVSVFLGIPYAQAPIGEARLMVSLAPSSVVDFWTEPHQSVLQNLATFYE